jgi:hydroxyacyl-ACP dehydratase HTD2-like protein with hotdog domain
VVPDTGDVIAPPTFAACFTLRGSEWVSDPELGAHANLVHGSQAFEFHRPLRVGDTLACTPTISDIANKGRMDILTVQVECVDAGTGQPAVTARSTIIFFNTDQAAV